MNGYLGIDCGSVSLNLVLLSNGAEKPVTLYRRTRGRPLAELTSALDDLIATVGSDAAVRSALVTGSGRGLIADALGIPAINEISAHASGIYRVDPRVRTVIEIGGQDSKLITLEPPVASKMPRVPVFRMNEICAAGTGAFLDEQAERVGIEVESFGSIALQSRSPAHIAGRCAVFAKTDMIHHAQEGAPLADILLGLAFSLARSYIATLVRGEPLRPVVSLQGGVMCNAAVVHAFRTLLGLDHDQIIIPQYFKVMGAVGCAFLAAEREAAGNPLSLQQLRASACAALEGSSRSSSSFQPLAIFQKRNVPTRSALPDTCSNEGPVIMGLDVGSVSVKAVLVDNRGRIVREKYLLSRSRTLETVEKVVEDLLREGSSPIALAVTGSGRYLVGRLLHADLIIDEISAQGAAALSHSPDVDTVVEIGGQDSKWITLEHGYVRDFEMNRVCAAGTGSFLMSQAQRLGLSMGSEFSDAAFASRRPADLGARCTVFMESDLVHHQNNGAALEDLAAGVCISIVHNYLDRVANNKPLGDKVLFLGGVAATPAVRAAFEQQTNRLFHVPDFFMVSGALGAALKAREKLHSGEIRQRTSGNPRLKREQIRTERFTCKGCANRCEISRYRSPERSVFHGGLCDRWEVEDGGPQPATASGPFALRASLLEEIAQSSAGSEDTVWGMARSPQFFEWLPFWSAFCSELGISLKVSPRTDRRQFENGLRYLRVETCLPMKAMAGHMSALVDSGVRAIFHPSILSERIFAAHDQVVEHCPYIQASSLFYRGAFDVEWMEPVISFALDSDSFKRESQRFAASLGFSRSRALQAYERGIEALDRFTRDLSDRGKAFLGSLREDELAVVVLGKPYHTADGFMNMSLASVFHRLGIKALPSDLYPFENDDFAPEVSWKYQASMIRAAREIAKDPRLYPVMITFFGCGPDPFALRHVRDALSGKPLLVLEMDEHSSRAGMITRIEAFIEQIANRRQIDRRARRSDFLASERMKADEPGHVPTSQAVRQPAEEHSAKSHRRTPSSHRAEILYLPYMCEHAYGFAAAAQSVGIDARVLPQPDEESEKLGRPHMVGGECHPYALILGDYLKLSQLLDPSDADRCLFYVLGSDACRLGQFPAYIEKIRKGLGLSIGVISRVDEGLAAFGISERNRQRIYLRGWEGLNAYDVLLRVFLEIRAYARDKAAAEKVYRDCRDRLFQALCTGRIRPAIEEVIHALISIPKEDVEARPAVSVTGDYYTRVVPYANNEVYREIESLGGIVWSPPTFSDSLKMATLRDLTWNLMNWRSREAAQKGFLYVLLAFSEFKVKGATAWRSLLDEPLDLLGRRMWKTAARCAETRLPSGITAPIATALHHLDRGADGILNLMTLNCSYGTVVTAALAQALKKRPGIPMLTLVYDGLKKTNERTRLEAFMEQVSDHFDNARRQA